MEHNDGVRRKSVVRERGAVGVLAGCASCGASEAETPTVSSTRAAAPATSDAGIAADSVEAPDAAAPSSEAKAPPAPGPGYCLASWDIAGTRLVIGGCDGSLQVWDPTTARRLHIYELEDDEESIDGVRLSPDGTKVAYLAFDGADTDLNLVDLESGTVLWRDSAHDIDGLGDRSTVDHVAFSPDGTLLASTGNDSVLRVWKVGDGSELASVERVGGSIAFVPGTMTLIAARGSEMYEHDYPEGGYGIYSRPIPGGVIDLSKPRARKKKFAAGTGPVTIDPKGRWMWLGRSAWDARTRRRRKKHDIPRLTIEDPFNHETISGSSPAISNDGRFIAVSDPIADSTAVTITVRELATFKIVHRGTHKGCFDSLAFADDLLVGIGGCEGESFSRLSASDWSELPAVDTRQ